MDKSIRAKAAIDGLMDVDHLRHLKGKFLFGEREVKFELVDRGSDLIAGNQLEKLLQQNQDVEKWIILVNIRWLGVIFKHGYYYIFNSHSCCVDGASDAEKRAPAAVFRAKTAEEAAKILKMFGMSADNPNSYFETHSLVLQ